MRQVSRILIAIGIIVIIIVGGGGVVGHKPPTTLANTNRPILAFYYPWWEINDWSYERMSDLPDPLYSGGDEETLQRHIEQADAAGIDAFICTWYGPDEDRLNKRCRQIMEMAREMGSDLQFTIIPDQSAWASLQSVEALVAALDVLERDFMSQSNYFYFQGRPTVFWFYPPSLGGVATWQELRNRADPNYEQFWFGGTDDFSFLGVYDTLYYFDITWESAPGVAMASYNRRLAGRAPFIATVMPGYDDMKFRAGHQRSREGGEYYRTTWENAVKYAADAVVITSFNEFFEGSHIEPSEQYGDLYLRLTREYGDYFHANVGQDSSTPTVPTPTPTDATVPSLPDDACQNFPETGYMVCGRLLEYWRANGGLPVFGYPITPQQTELIEGQPFQVQHFERNRLELHPENNRPYDVLLGRLGADRLNQQLRDWQDFPVVQEAASGCRYFVQTQHSLCDPFLSYWRSHGLELDGVAGYSVEENMALFGLPLSEPQMEELSDGQEYTVQWFERARFEYHPENAPPYDVLLGLLGNEVGGQ